MVRVRRSSRSKRPINPSSSNSSTCSSRPRIPSSSSFSRRSVSMRDSAPTRLRFQASRAFFTPLSEVSSINWPRCSWVMIGGDPRFNGRTRWSIETTRSAIGSSPAACNIARGGAMSGTPLTVLPERSERIRWPRTPLRSGACRSCGTEMWSSSRFRRGHPHNTRAVS